MSHCRLNMNYLNLCICLCVQVCEKKIFEILSVIVKMQKSDFSTFHVQWNSLKTSPKKVIPPVTSRQKAQNFSQLAFIITHKCTVNIIQVYIKKVSLCNLLVSAFSCHHQGANNQCLAKLHTFFLNFSSWKYNFIKLKCFTSSLHKFLDSSCWNYNFIKLLKF